MSHNKLFALYSLGHAAGFVCKRFRNMLFLKFPLLAWAAWQLQFSPTACGTLRKYVKKPLPQPAAPDCIKVGSWAVESNQVNPWLKFDFLTHLLLNESKFLELAWVSSSQTWVSLSQTWLKPKILLKFIWMPTLVATKKEKKSEPLRLAIPGSYTEGTRVPFNGLRQGIGDTLN